jgi:outer membrane protein assembly factor BamE (lipoprotein component of BamABCDE complex)
MMKKQILLWCIVISLNASCTSITQLFPKEPRPFQKREFNSAEWKNSDYQTRGEMANRDSSDSLIERLYKIEGNNTQEQILELLGKPDQKTKAACCYAGRAGRSGEKDLWIYYIEVEKEAGKTSSKALKIYFDGNRVQPNVGNRDGDHDYFPAIG